MDIFYEGDSRWSESGKKEDTWQVCNASEAVTLKSSSLEVWKLL